MSQGGAGCGWRALDDAPPQGIAAKRRLVAQQQQEEAESTDDELRQDTMSKLEEGAKEAEGRCRLGECVLGESCMRVPVGRPAGRLAWVRLAAAHDEARVVLVHCAPKFDNLCR
jgi:hypothetical protein